jgi:hypothetical protein
LAEQDQVDEAATCFAEASRLHPEKSLWRLRSAALCPVVFDSVADLDRYRRNLDAALDAHRDAAGGVDWREIAADGAVPSFNLAHHGCNNRPLLEKFAALYQASLPRRELRGRKGGRKGTGALIDRSRRSW